MSKVGYPRTGGQVEVTKVWVDNAPLGARVENADACIDNRNVVAVVFMEALHKSVSCVVVETVTAAVEVPVAKRWVNISPWVLSVESTIVRRVKWAV